jgi:hypothetical protein
MATCLSRRRILVESIYWRHRLLPRKRELAGRRLVRDGRLLVDEVLMVWPAEKRGWPRRTAYIGSRQALEEVEPAVTRTPAVGKRPAVAAGVRCRSGAATS